MDGDPLQSGAQVLDLSANKNHGTLTNGLSLDVPIETRAGTTNLITTYGPGLYRIKFGAPLGDTLQVPASEAGQSFSAVELSGQPVLIRLGDINGDGYEDAIVSVRDSVLNLSDINNPKTFARIAFGSANGLDPSLVQPAITLQLNAPILAGTAGNRTEITQAGDLDGDGFDDVAIAVTRTGGGQGVYILFGRADWSGTTLEASDGGLLGEYYLLPASVPSTDLDLIDFSALTPTHTRVDSQVNFPMTGDSGFGGFSEFNNRFAIRWTGQINIETAGEYRFFLNSDDGSKLFIDGALVVDNDGLHAPTEVGSAGVVLDAGFHDIRVEMFENFGLAGVEMRWIKPGSVTKEIVPSNVLFRDARGVINVPTDADVFIPVATGPVSAAGVGDVTSVYGRGLFGEFYDMFDGTSLATMPSLADGQMLRNASTGGLAGATTLTLTGLAEHTSIDLELLLGIIGNWGGASGADRFNITIDTGAGPVSVFSHTFSNVLAGPQSYVPPAGGKLLSNVDSGFGSGLDSLYDMGREATLKSIAHTGSTLTIHFFADGAGWQGGDQESFALDNLRVTLNTAGGAVPVYASNFNAGAPAELSGVTTVEAVQGFGPTATHLDNSVAYNTAGGSFVNVITGTSIPGLATEFAARWTGSLFFDPPGDAASGAVSFIVISDDGHRCSSTGSSCSTAISVRSTDPTRTRPRIRSGAKPW